MPCREVVYADAVLTANSPEAKRHLTERLESKSGLDGHCEKKPIIRSVIAALCAYDNQFLGKILLKFGQDGDGKNLNDDQDARSWFEADIHLGNFTFPRLFMVFELLVLSFYFRANQSRELPELAGFPEKAPAGLMSTSHSNREESRGLFLQDKCPPWDNAEEVAAWKESVEWWKGKCSFCAGRGLGGALMEHTLQQCQRGGASKLESELGIAMYVDGIVPSNGCDVCLRPFDFCPRWLQDEDGNFTRRETSKARRKCERYRFLLADIAIGLFHCGKGKFKMEMLDDAEEYCEQHEYSSNNLDEETVACSLAQHLIVVGVFGSVLIRRVNSWTREIRQDVR
ncbi:hypothetical protein H9L39_17842 [Fusarium oxysporum f. sp. albedinis]|nr:hypothetical protein H9L39_17842 [Fusarium oxysporum f. sp. albedinis]